MNDLISTIQQDILNPDVALSTILLKSKVLAYQLKNDNFKNWVRNELDGYPFHESLPAYRIIETALFGHIVSRSFDAQDMPIGLSGTPKWFQEAARIIEYREGISAVEKMADAHTLHFAWPAEWIGIWNKVGGRGIQQLISVDQPVPAIKFTQIAQTVRSRLQDLILELSDLPWIIGEQPIPSEKVDQIVNVTIYNNQGENVSAFDQRNQQVQNQNNAARDVNISGVITINNSDELSQAVRGLRDSVSQIDPERQEEAVAAIEVLETAIQDAALPKSEIAKAVETLSGSTVMRQGLENLVTGTASGLVSTALIETIKFVLGMN